MEPLHYLDFELKIERKRKGGLYTAQVIHSPAGEASCDFKLPFSDQKLEILVLKIGLSRKGTRRIHTEEMEAARELGGELFDAVFSGEVHSCLKRSKDEFRRQKGQGIRGLRLKLRLQDAPELSNLPWEFLLDRANNLFLTQSIETPIVRYIEMQEPIPPITVTLPLQLLVMVSSPSDEHYEKLDVEREKAQLQKALAPLIKGGKIHLEWMEDATSETLQRRLRSGKYHMFHFIGHGGFDREIEEGVLVLTDERGRGWEAGAHRIGAIFHDYKPRLVVLNSCEGARNSPDNTFAGVATTLIQQGIPAVVAMQFEITDKAAIKFSSEFYTAIAEGFPVDAAVAEARKAIYLMPNDVEWGTPVLYMRSNDGILFDLKQGAAEPVIVKQEPEKQKAAASKIKEEKEGDALPATEPVVAKKQSEKPKKIVPEITKEKGGDARAKARFVFSDLTAKDKKTGLIWARDANIADKSMTWSDAFKFIDELNKQKYAGYSDWRLPAKKELLTLVDYAKSQGYKRGFNRLFNKISFKNVQATFYWSSTSYAYTGYTGAAWDVRMSDGVVGAYGKAGTLYVWPVRSGQ